MTERPWASSSLQNKPILASLLAARGIGISIAANKVSGIRAALAHDVMTACLAREHNEVLALAAAS